MVMNLTCRHAALVIASDDNQLRPQRQILLPGAPALLWLTSLPSPTKEQLCIQSIISPCDRMAAVFQVDTDQAVRWTRWAHTNKIPLEFRFHLDGVPGSAPRTWWVSEVILPAVRVQ
jgi:hypothetical protein